MPGSFVKVKTVIKLSLLMPVVSLTALSSYRVASDAGTQIGGDAAVRTGAAGMVPKLEK